MQSRRFRGLLAMLEDLTPGQERVVMRRMMARMPVEADAEDPEVCPHCSASEFIGWGQARGRQRWKCKECSRTFGKLTNTAAHGLAHEDAWPEFVRALMDGAVLRKIAERCGIHITTAHRWRTRFLEGLVEDQPELQGIAEVDETMLRRSAKGQPKVREELGRPPRKRGGGRGSGGPDHSDNMEVVFAVDRHQTVAFQIVDSLTTERAHAILDRFIAPDTVLCTDGHKAYINPARDLGLEHHRLVAKKRRVRGAYHL